MTLTVLLSFGAVVAVILLLGAAHDDLKQRRPRRRIELPLLHSINDDRCIGCEACVDVCPTKVLELVEHKAKVVHFQDCVQCEQCAWSCPTTALVMYRQGTQPRSLTVPELDDHFQTAVPGQYLIGEVAGKPLVKNAANLGRAVIEHVRRSGLTPGPGQDDVVDVAIIGSGPGGLSAGLTCMKYGLSYVIIEKEHVVASTVARYPKGKNFMAEPVGGDNLSFLPVFDATKEDLVAAWSQLVDELHLPLKRGEAVESIKKGDDGIFAVKTTVAIHRARRVVLATGLRGKPRLLTVPGANLVKVHAMLEDPTEFAGQKVVVVGGGDSALEAALALADAGAVPILSYRGDSIKRAKPANQKSIAEYVRSLRLELILESEVTAFTETTATIKLVDGSERVVENHQAFVLIGAEPPVEWLQKLGVRFVERPHTYQLGTTDQLVRMIAPEATPCPADPRQAAAIVRGEAVKLPRRPRTNLPKRHRTLVEVVEEQFTHVKTAVNVLRGNRRATTQGGTGEQTAVNTRVRGFWPDGTTDEPIGLADVGVARPAALQRGTEQLPSLARPARVSKPPPLPPPLRSPGRPAVPEGDDAFADDKTEVQPVAVADSWAAEVDSVVRRFAG